MGTTWTAVFVVFLLSHVVGDYLLQTEWQALNKSGWLTGSGESRRAIGGHMAGYALAFVPALIWVGREFHTLGAAGAIGVGLFIVIPHAIVDDGRIVQWWLRAIK